MLLKGRTKEPPQWQVMIGQCLQDEHILNQLWSLLSEKEQVMLESNLMSFFKPSEFCLKEPQQAALLWHLFTLLAELILLCLQTQASRGEKISAEDLRHCLALIKMVNFLSNKAFSPVLCLDTRFQRHLAFIDQTAYLQEGWLVPLYALMKQERIAHDIVDYFQATGLGAPNLLKPFTPPEPQNIQAELKQFETQLIAYFFYKPDYLAGFLKLFGSQNMLHFFQSLDEVRYNQCLKQTGLDKGPVGIAEAMMKEVSHELVHYDSLTQGIEITAVRGLLEAYNDFLAKKNKDDLFSHSLQSVYSLKSLQTAVKHFLDLAMKADPAYRQFVSSTPQVISGNEFWLKNKVEMFRLLEMNQSLTKRMNTNLDGVKATKSKLNPSFIPDFSLYTAACDKHSQNKSNELFASGFIAEKLYNFFVLSDRTVWLDELHEAYLEKLGISIEKQIFLASLRVLEQLKMDSSDRVCEKVNHFYKQSPLFNNVSQRNLLRADQETDYRQAFLNNLALINQYLLQSWHLSYQKDIICSIHALNSYLDYKQIEQFISEQARLAIYTVIMGSSEMHYKFEHQSMEQNAAYFEYMMHLKSKEGINPYQIFYNVIRDAYHLRTPSAPLTAN